MASVIPDKNKQGKPNGCRTLQFVDGDKNRRRIRLGKVNAKAADTIKGRVETILADLIAQKSWDRETAEWVRNLDQSLHDKLAAVGLLPERDRSERRTLGPFVEAYIQSRTADVVQSTLNNWQLTKGNLLAYFGENTPLANITPGDAEEWRAWLKLDKNKRFAGRSGCGLHDNTVRKRCSIARQFFGMAKRKRFIEENPFVGMSEGLDVRPNKSREYFVPRADMAKVLKHCPNDEFRLIVALSRFAGLRCPSEHLALTWGDVDWSDGTILVHSPKTARHKGKETRLIPLFDDLRPYLEKVLPAKPEGPIVRRYRHAGINLRTQLLRAIAKAELEPWPRLFHNLRASFATELEFSHGSKLAAAWCGHTEKVASEFYWQVTRDDLQRGKCVLKCELQPAESTCEDVQHNEETPENSSDSRELVGASSSPGGTGISPQSPGKSKQGRRRAAQSAANSDDGLALIVDAWPELSPDARARILAIVRDTR